MNTTRLNLDKLGGKFAQDLQHTYKEILLKGMDEKQIRAAISKATIRVNETYLGYNNRIRTLSRTLSHSIDNLLNFNNAQKAGFEHFQYIGNPVPERQFCKEHLNKTYHIDDIKKMDNGQGVSVIASAGGYNCRHMWVPVIPDIDLENY